MILYDYLDHSVASLAEIDRFLLDAMRRWVDAAQTRRCGCGYLAAAFERRGVGAVLPDFGIAMMTLARDGRSTLYLEHHGCATLSEDEARLLALFAQACEGSEGVAMIAATLVVDDAATRLVQATRYVGGAMLAAAGGGR